VQRPSDIEEARELSLNRTAIMAKIEKPTAIHYLKDIVDLADGIMVARGDLGVEMPVEKVPGLQKQISRAARNAGKPVVVATQMLESMIYAPVPTRAEVSDVATAVFEGADAVMLSAESAVGKYPVDAVATMNRIAIEVEQDPLHAAIIHAQRIDPQATGADAISAAARTVAETLDLAAIVCYTATGSTALRAARERPQQPILALTPIPRTARKLTIVWGQHCVLADDPFSLDDMVAKACRIAYQEGFAKAGEKVIVTAGVPLGKSGSTNLLRIAEVDPTEDVDIP
jgi:pyruvate kinase